MALSTPKRLALRSSYSTKCSQAKTSVQVRMSLPRPDHGPFKQLGGLFDRKPQQVPSLLPKPDDLVALSKIPVNPKPSTDPKALRDHGNSHAAEPPIPEDHPSLDYVRRQPQHTEDDPSNPESGAAAAVAALAGPDMHAPLKAPGPPEGGRRALSVVEQLRIRAVYGSSDVEDDAAEEGEEWRSMDIPALLMSPHHASALHSLSSSDEDTTGVPDFADLTRAQEAQRAAQAAAEAVAPALQPLARAAGILSYLSSQGASGARLGPSGAESEPRLKPTRFDGLPEEPLTAEQLEAAASLLARNNIAPAGSLAGRALTTPAGSGADGDVTVTITANVAVEVGPGGAGGSSGGSTAAAKPSAAAAAIRAAAARVPAPAKVKAVVAAAAAAVAEEGVEWLNAVAPAGEVPEPAKGAAASVAGPEPAGVSMDLDEEHRAVRLRCQEAGAGLKTAVDPALRNRIADAIARDIQYADAHVVRSAPASATPADGKASALGQFVTLRSASVQRPGGPDAATAAVVQVATAGGKAASDAAAAALAAEQRLAVGGEVGWPYGAAVRTEDLVEELKQTIHDQQEDAEHGSIWTLLP